jgi:hypothetical protein
MTLTKATYSMINGAVVNVLDYGAVGDGTANDTAAIQAAIDSLSVTSSATSNGSGTVYFPAGNYRITDTIRIGYGITLLGDGAGGYPFVGANAHISRITADFGASNSKWAIDSATYITSTGLPVAYNAFVDAAIDTTYNSLHNVAIKGLYIFDANASLQTNVVYGAIRLIGCPNAIISDVSILGFGVGVQLNTCFGTTISNITSLTNYYGLMAYNANNNISVQGQFDKIIDPSDLTIPVGNIPSWMPTGASFTTDFYMDSSHNASTKGVTIAAAAAVGSNSATINVIGQYWQDTAFLFNSYANTFVSLYAENNRCENVLSSAQSSWSVLNMQNFTSSASYVVDAGLQSVGYINIGGNNLSADFFNNLWGSLSSADPSYVLVENKSNTLTAFAIPDHPRLRRVAGQGRDTVTPTVASSAGTITSVTNGEASWVKNGNQITVYFTFTVADNGTGSATITVEDVMPFPCSSTIGASGTAVSSTAGMCLVTAAPTFSTFVIRKYDSTYPAVTGSVIYGSFTYYASSTI